jgi:serine protease Do
MATRNTKSHKKMDWEVDVPRHSCAFSWLILFSFVINALLMPVATAKADVDYALEQTAIRESVANVADCVVQIRTVGGFDRVGETQVSQGPTTGLIVTSDGYIVSSAFNFAQRPSSILVSLPGGKQLPAELVARDLNRMLVLLKLETEEPLPVPAFVPRREIEVGQTAIALGRSLQTDKVDTSLGIISGLNRLHGRAIQTDCSISAANYGGSLIDIRGRVFGVLVPMSPQAGGEGIENEVAGTEFYDSGIGFAVPLEHVFAILERWKQGDDLVPGKLGVSLKPGSAITEAPTVVATWPGSPAAKAGWQPDDTIIAVNGEPVATQNELQFLTKPLYAGDKLTVSLRRGTGDKAEEFDSEVELVAKLKPFRAAFLGIMPAATTKADDEKKGFTLGAIWPDSPAAEAGFKTGDSLIKLGEAETPSFDAALAVLQGMQPAAEVKATIKRGDEELTLTATLANQPEQILSAAELKLPAAAETTELREFEKFKLPQFPQEATYLAPADKASTTGLVVWLASTKDEEQAVARLWQPLCDRDGLVVLFARPGDEAGWQFEDLEYLDQLSRAMQAKFTTPRSRTIIIGSGKAGQLAYALGLRRRETFGGIVADNAPLPRTMKVPENSATRLVNLLTITPRKSALAPLVKHDIEQLRTAGYPVSLADRPEVKSSEEQLDATTIDTIARWLAGLRRL